MPAVDEPHPSDDESPQAQASTPAPADPPTPAAAAPAPAAPTSGDALTRRELMQLLAGLGGATAAAFGGWGALEALKSPGPVESWRKSVCRFCGVGCGVLVGMRGDEILEIRGDERAHNKGVVCVKGSLLSALSKVEGRLLRPQIRTGGKLVDASWDDAMALVAERFQQTLDSLGPTGVAFYGSGQLFIEESYTANKLFKAGLGSNNVDGNPRLCMASAAFGYTRVFGKDEPPGAYEDLDHASCFFVIGANPFDCHPSLFERIQARRRADPSTTLICVDPRRTPTAAHADQHLQIRPGSDMLLLHAMLHVIVEDDLVDHDFLTAHARIVGPQGDTDLAGLRGFVADASPEAVADRVGVSAEDIRRAAFRFATSPGTVSLWTMGLNQRVEGVHLNETLCGLHLVTGQICRPGATPLSLTGQCNACGGVRDTGSLAHLLPNGRKVADPTHRQEMERLWGVPEGRIAAQPGLDALRLFEAMGDGRVGACLVMCTNPAQSLPAARKYREGMDRAFLVVADAFGDTETAAHADVLLPAALWVEKEGVYGQTERRYQLVEKLVDPPGEARSDLQILQDLAARLGQDQLVPRAPPEEVWEEYRQISKHSKYDFSGITYPRLRALPGLQWPCPGEDHPGTVRRYLEGDDPFVPAGERVRFYGKPDGKAVVFLRPHTPSPEVTDATYPLVLTTGRVLEQWHTGTMTYRIPELRDGSGPARFEVSPRDARRLGLDHGDRVEVSSRYGSVEGEVRLSDSLREGLLFCAFYDAKLLVNDGVADHVDPASRQPEYKRTAVAVRKLEGA